MRVTIAIVILLSAYGCTRLPNTPQEPTTCELLIDSLNSLYGGRISFYSGIVFQNGDTTEYYITPMRPELVTMQPDTFYYSRICEKSAVKIYLSKSDTSYYLEKFAKGLNTFHVNPREATLADLKDMKLWHDCRILMVNGRVVASSTFRTAFLILKSSNIKFVPPDIK